MIVNDVAGKWEVIFQRNHALIAGHIAMMLKTKFRPPYWVETLAAIMDHDDGQNDLSSKEHITSEGFPKGFREIKFHLEQAQRVVEMASYKSQWVYLLLSMHAYALRRNVPGKSAELKKFLRQQENHHSSLQEFFGMSNAEIWNCYSFLRWCDELSLLLCENRVDQFNRSMLIGCLPNLIEAEIEWRSENSYTVRPWVFGVDHFQLASECFVLPHRKFATCEELKTTIKSLRPTIRRWNFSI